MPEGNPELVQVSIDPRLNRRLERAVQTTGLDHGLIIRWAVLTKLPQIESAQLPAQADRSNGTRPRFWQDQGRNGES